MKTTLVAAAAALLFASCATAPLPDLTARAPRLDGFGRATLQAATASAAAQALFAQGMQQAYAFNAPEAVRAFKAALAADPRCALCAWGVAWQLGPNINAPQRGDLADARRHVVLAQRLAAGATPFEQALADAMALRYGASSDADVLRDGPGAGEVCAQGAPGRAHPLDIAYAERMRGLADALPLQPDVVSLYVEAEMIATREDWWDDVTGRPAGRIGELPDRIDGALAAAPDHTGLNHYMVHATDTVAWAVRAVPAADRLAALAPASPHLVHMPSHTYAHVGRYADAARANETALAAELALTQALAAQDAKPLHNWDGHNLHFLWFAALMEGRGELALATARRSAGRAGDGTSPWAAYRRALPTLTLLRLERWDDVLREPPTPGALDAAVRGIALVRSGRLAEARTAQATVQQATAKAGAREQPVLAVVANWLRAEVGIAEGRLDAAQDALATAVRDEDAAGGEPPLLASGSRLRLGALQLQRQAWAQAEATYREALRLDPGSGWALRGLAAALDGMQRTDATDVRRRLAAAWPQADAALLR